jgi:hypothetical protein
MDAQDIRYGWTLVQPTKSAAVYLVTGPHDRHADEQGWDDFVSITYVAGVSKLDRAIEMGLRVRMNAHLDELRPMVGNRYHASFAQESIERGITYQRYDELLGDHLVVHGVIDDLVAGNNGPLTGERNMAEHYWRIHEQAVADGGHPDAWIPWWQAAEYLRDPADWPLPKGVAA